MNQNSTNNIIINFLYKRNNKFWLDGDIRETKPYINIKNKFWLDGDIRDEGAYAYARQNHI
jgi:hypothetical protein